MPDEPPLQRRSVREFIKHHGLSRNGYLIIRAKAGVKPKDYDSMLSPSDEKALVHSIGTEKYKSQIFRDAQRPPAVTTRWVPPPPPVIDEEAEAQAEAERIQAEIDHEARISVMIDQRADSLVKWRKALVELVKEHVADHAGGQCKECHVASPCPTKQALIDLDSQLVEEIAVWDSGNIESTADEMSFVPELRLSALTETRNRWRTALTKLTIDHMIDNPRKRCPQCDVVAPCKTKAALMRINFGITKEIERFATLDDEELELALGNRRMRDYDTDGWRWAPHSG